MYDTSPGLLQPLTMPIFRFVINNSTYIGQNVPSLYSALTVGGNYSSDPRVYGHVNPYVVKHNDVVEIVINNLNANLHPWHLHGHQFQVLERTLPDTGSFPGTYSNFSSTPVRRDTVMLQPNAYAVIRFRADNPDKLPSSIISQENADNVYASGFSIATSSSTSCPASQLPSSKLRKYSSTRDWPSRTTT